MIGIIGAMKVELEALKARLQDVTVTRISGVDFYSGKLHGTDAVSYTHLIRLPLPFQPVLTK